MTKTLIHRNRRKVRICSDMSKKDIITALDNWVGLQNLTPKQVQNLVSEGLCGHVGEPNTVDGYWFEQWLELTDYGQVMVHYEYCGYGAGCFTTEQVGPLY